MTIPQLTPVQVAAGTTGARIVDVREPDEVATGAIAGSTAIPLGQLATRTGDSTRPPRSSRCARAANAASRLPNSSPLPASPSATWPAA